MSERVDAFVIGRLCADLYPLQINTPLEQVRTFERFVGGSPETSPPAWPDSACA